MYVYLLFIFFIVSLFIYLYYTQKDIIYINERELFNYFETNSYQSDLIITCHSKYIFNLLDLLLRNNSYITLYFKNSFFNNLYKSDIVFLEYLLEKYPNTLKIYISDIYMPESIYSFRNNFAYLNNTYLNNNTKYLKMDHLNFSIIQNFKYKEQLLISSSFEIDFNYLKSVLLEKTNNN